MNVNYGHRAKIGVLLPSGNVTAEPQLQAMLPNGVSLHATRLKLTGSSPGQLLAMIQDVEPAARLLADAEPDLIVFHCTAVSTWDAEMDTALCERIRKATGIPAITTASALIAALSVLKATRIVMVSPYIEAISAREVAFLSHHGISTAREVCLGIDHPQDMHAVEPSTWHDMVMANIDPDAHAYFISCTAIRSLEVIDRLESRIGRPVITSNQVMMWHALRAIGINDRLDALGRLFAAEAPPANGAGTAFRLAPAD